MLGSAPLGGAPLAGSAKAGVATYTLALAPGAFALLGDGETLTEQPVLHAQPGAFAVAGQSVGLLKPTYNLAAAAGSFSLSGVPISVRRNYGLTATAGQFVYAVQAAVAFERTLRQQPGSFALTGGAATVLNGFSIQLGLGGFVLGGALSARATRVAQVPSQALALTGKPVTLRQGRAVRLVAIDLRMGVQPVAFSLGFVMKAQAAAFTSAHPAILLRATRELVAAAATYTLVSSDARAQPARGLALRPASFELAGSGVLRRGRVAVIPSLALSLGGSTVKATAVRRIQLQSGAFALVGAPPPPAKATRILPAQPGALHLAGAAGGGMVGRTLHLGAGTFAINVAIARFVIPQRVIQLDAGSFSLRGSAPGLTDSGSLAGLGAGPRWIMLSTITVQGQESVQDFVAGAPLQVSAVAPATQQVVTGSLAPQSYPIAGELELTINHGLDYIPRVTITDAAGFEYDASINHTAGVVTVALGGHINGRLTIGG